MKHAIAIVLFLAALSPRVFAASPAATQQWVRNYVSTNTTAGGVSAQWVMDYVRTNTSETSASSMSESSLLTRARNAVLLSMIDADMSGLHALTFLYPFTTNTLTTVYLADSTTGNGWTNAVYSCAVVTNQSHEATLTIGELEYNCSSFSNCTSYNDFTRIVGNVTNVVNMSYSSVTTNTWKTARGEN